MPRKIVIVRLSAVGDVVHGLPLARSLRGLHPSAEIVWTVQPGPAPLLAGHPWVDRTRLFPRRDGPFAVTRFLYALRREQFDLAVDLQGNLKSALVLAATGAPRRVGLAMADRREALGVLAANSRALPARGPHSVDRTLALCRALGDPDPKAEFGLAPTPAELEAARDDLSEVPSPVAAISVGGESDVREWTDDGYLAATRRLEERGITTLILAGPEHAERGRRIAALAGLRHRAGTTDLRGLLAHLAVLAERRAALLACDSAPIHLAVAVGLPAIALSGPQDPSRTGPYGHAEHAVTRWEGLPCAPCLKRTCRLAEEPRACIRRIDPETAATRLSDALYGT